MLPLKIEMTKDLITAPADLVLLGEFALGLGLLDLAESYLPSHDNGALHKPSEYIFPLILMLNGRGESIEDRTFPKNLP